MWFIYLDNYLRAKISNINTDIIYFPAENNLNFNLDGSFTTNELNSLHSVMDNSVSKLDFNLDNNTYICISSPTSFDFQAVKLITEYFQQNFPEPIIIFGGYHASSCPDDFRYSNSPVDYTVIGEGERALHNIVTNDSKKQDLPIIIEGTPITDLDGLPPLDLTLIEKYINFIKNKARALAISLSRGCPHNCSFCIEENLVKGKKIKRWRAFSPKRAVEEANTLINFGLNQGIKHFGFLDPCFGFNEKWLNNFLDLYEVDKEIIYHFIETRIDILNQNLISKLQEKKMYQFYGVDSFSNRMLEIMNKTHNPTEYLNQFEKVLAIHKKLDYKCNLGILVNHPGETKETLQKTLNHLKNIKEKDNNEVFHHNITMYHLFAKTMNYEQLDVLNKKHGTKAYFPDWWKNNKTLRLGTFAIRPSSELSLRESLNYFIEKELEIDRITYERNKKERFGLFLGKTAILKKQKNDLIKFLDDNNIETEES